MPLYSTQSLLRSVSLEQLTKRAGCLRVLVSIALLALVIVCGCEESPVGLIIPEFRNGGSLATTTALTNEQLSRLDGIWYVEKGRAKLGDSVVIKVSGDRLTVYARPNAFYMQLESGYVDSAVLFEGFWREQVNSNTGLVRCSIPRTSAGDYIVTGKPLSGDLKLEGSFGQGTNNNSDDIVLHWVRPFSERALKPFAIIAHRAGGRTSDRIPHSENTVELIRTAERYGSNGIEIDVRLSADGVPFLYHDTQLNPRLVQKGALVGPPENYPIRALQSLVTLINGETIPTLAQALDVIVNETNLQFVYLDTKTENSGLISKMIPLQAAAMKAAQQKPGRKSLLIVVGIPTDATYDELLSIPSHSDIPTIIEPSYEQALGANALVWSPRWTLGTQLDRVHEAQANGMGVVTWTLDDDAFIRQYLANGNFNGFLTNYPTLVTWHVYMQ